VPSTLALASIAVESDDMTASVILGVLTAAELAGVVAMLRYVQRRRSH
jgi:hypothetical protein